jgi:hypothetical protein
MPPTSIATGDRRVALDIVRKTVHDPLVEIVGGDPRALPS